MITKYIYRIFCILTFGMLLSLWILQNNEHVQQRACQELVKLLEETFNIRIEKEYSRVNFFTCSVLIRKGHITSQEKKDFWWEYDECKVSFSPLVFVLQKKLGLHITLYNVRAQSSYQNGQSDLIDHMHEVLAPAPFFIDIEPHVITVNNFELDLNTAQGRLHTALQGCLKIVQAPLLKSQSIEWSGSLNLCDGSVLLDGTTIADNLTGSIKLSQKKQSPYLYATAQTMFALPTCACNEKFYLLANLKDGIHTFIFKNRRQQSLTLSHDATNKQLHATGKIPLRYIAGLSSALSKNNQTQKTLPLDGLCKINTIISTSDDAITSSGNITFSDLTLDGQAYQPINITLDSHPYIHDLTQSNTHEKAATTNLHAHITWDNNQNLAHIHCTNHTTIRPFSCNAGKMNNELSINPLDLFLHTTYDTNGHIQGEYKVSLSNNVTQKTYPFSGSLNADPQTFTINGATASGTYTVTGKRKPTPALTSVIYKKNNEKLVNLHNKPGNILQGLISYRFLRTFLNYNTKRFLRGKNSQFMVSVDQNNLAHLHGNFELAQGTLYIPENRNLIEGCSCSFDLAPYEKKLAINNGVLRFCKGTVTCPHATFNLDRAHELDIIHAPLQIDDLFINVKKDLYAIIYGNLLLNKLPESFPHLSGYVIVKKALLKENFFSANTKTDNPLDLNKLGINTVGFDIKVTNEKPIKTTTSTLDGYANINLHAHYTPHKDLVNVPKLSGSVELEKGFLKFLHNKLYIEHGKIQFLANQINDPLIDLSARNRINRYLIHLHVTGSLQNQTILLESTPELSEEQILSLLVAGSENATLQTNLPTMLLQNLDSLLLHTTDIQPKAKTLFEKVTKPLKYVQISPDLANKAGPKGLKGSISVTLNDQIRAQVEKNLNLQEDFSAQLEYLLTDDLHLKVVKDQRGEIGSELELRLKF
ncbi:MAG: translocation/assembly module TamB domain-containing protein [Epsilonproteobacteria bacterium]|nr:translocation/assembly module TamB domain-containing protein [Campylobacterota bacterium]